VKALPASEALRRHYRDWYAGGSEWHRICAADKADNVIALCGELGCRDVLEIGAGEGSVLARLSEQGFGESLYALEISPGGSAAIQRRGIPRLVECRLYDGGALPHPDGRFDLAILSHVLEHVEDPRQLLREASRVARHVFVEVPAEDTLRLPADFVFDALGHINTWSPRTFRRLVQSCGLRVLGQITTCPGVEGYVFQRGVAGRLVHLVKRLLLALSPAVATRVFTYHTALVCTVLRERETA